MRSLKWSCLGRYAPNFSFEVRQCGPNLVRAVWDEMDGGGVFFPAAGPNHNTPTTAAEELNQSHGTVGSFLGAKRSPTTACSALCQCLLLISFAKALTLMMFGVSGFFLSICCCWFFCSRERCSEVLEIVSLCVCVCLCCLHIARPIPIDFEQSIAPFPYYRPNVCTTDVELD